MGWQDAPVLVAQGQAEAAELPAPRVPEWQRAPANEQLRESETAAGPAALRQHFQTVASREANSFEDYLRAGFQQSVTGLAVRGKAPDVAIGADSPWYGRLTANAVGMVGDLPAMVPGFIGGSAAGSAVGSAVPVIGTAAGGVVGGFAGAGALPAGLRSAMMEAYSKGEVRSASDFIDRALSVAWETTKGGIVGGATGAAGRVAGVVLPAAAPLAVRAAAPTAAQIVTMTTVGRALEGQLPEPQDFVDAAIVIGGMQAAGAVAGKLRTIYAKTGIPPEQVVADASREPIIKAELTAEPSKGPQASLASPPPPQGGEPVRPAGTVQDAIEAERLRTIGQGQLELPGIPKAYQAIAQEETARAIVPGEKAAKVAERPFAMDLPQAPGEPAQPTHVNYNLINSPEETKLALARLSQVYEQEIQTQRRGTVSWDQTSLEAGKMLADTLGGVDQRLVMPREPGTPAGAAEILARKQMVVGAAESMMAARDELLAKGAAATQADQLMFLQAIERSALIQSEFLGARAEAGRALNILKSTAMEAERVKLVQDVIESYGTKNPLKLAEMLREIDNPAGALKFAREVVKATTWEKIVEAWKAGLVSGPVTHIANIMGNTTFALMRAPVDALAAVIGRLRGAELGERLSGYEPLARLFGNLQGTQEGLRVGIEMMKAEDAGSVVKGEQFRHAIEGKKGEIIRLPFRALGAEDAVFSAMNERGEAYSLATRQAAIEGLNPLTQQFRERVAQLAMNPTAEMAKEIEAAGKRFTFNAEMGEKGKAVQKFVRTWHLEWAVPFIRTPGNIAKELLRMTPLAPALKEWRDAFQAGGIARDRAFAEIALGSSVMSVIFGYALNGRISGQGDPDPGKRRVQIASGWQPYSIKIGDTWYSYQRLQPIGTLIGMASDAAAVWDHLTEEESDKVPKMLSVAFANAITNQTFLQGITNIVNAMSDPTRFGARLVQQFAASGIPNIIGQPVAMLDPVQREVDSVLDAVKARLPFARQSLYAKRDVFGEPMETKAKLAGISPITESKEADDKVRSEAARLGVSVADTPKKTHIGRGSGKLGEVKLEPEERDRFAETGGKLAHELLASVVMAPGWDDLPDLVKKRTFEKVFSQAHKVAALEAIPLEKRATLSLEISEKVMRALQPSNEAMRVPQ